MDKPFSQGFLKFATEIVRVSMHCLQHTATLLLLHTVTFSIFNIVSETPLVWRFFSHPQTLINKRASVGGYADQGWKQRSWTN
jgi:hypothetical protein